MQINMYISNFIPFLKEFNKINATIAMRHKIHPPCLHVEKIRSIVIKYFGCRYGKAVHS